MAYTRTTWVNEETPLNADNLNNIEDGIEELQGEFEIDPAVKSLASAMGWIAPE